jgi:hypothetical protein
MDEVCILRLRIKLFLMNRYKLRSRGVFILENKSMKLGGSKIEYKIFGLLST